MLRRLGLPLLALACVCFMGYHLQCTHRHLPDLEPVVTPARSIGTWSPPWSSIQPQRGDLGCLLQPGVVEEVAVEEGQKVRQGDLLFRLDDRELKARLDAANRIWRLPNRTWPVLRMPPA